MTQCAIQGNNSKLAVFPSFRSMHLRIPLTATASPKSDRPELGLTWTHKEAFIPAKNSSLLTATRSRIHQTFVSSAHEFLRLTCQLFVVLSAILIRYPKQRWFARVLQPGRDHGIASVKPRLGCMLLRAESVAGREAETVFESGASRLKEIDPWIVY